MGDFRGIVELLLTHRGAGCWAAGVRQTVENPALKRLLLLAVRYTLTYMGVRRAAGTSMSLGGD